MFFAVSDTASLTIVHSPAVFSSFHAGFLNDILYFSQVFLIEGTKNASAEVERKRIYFSERDSMKTVVSLCCEMALLLNILFTEECGKKCHQVYKYHILKTTFY